MDEEIVFCGGIKVFLEFFSIILLKPQSQESDFGLKISVVGYHNLIHGRLCTFRPCDDCHESEPQRSSLV